MEKIAKRQKFTNLNFNLQNEVISFIQVHQIFEKILFLNKQMLSILKKNKVLKKIIKRIMNIKNSVEKTNAHYLIYELTKKFSLKDLNKGVIDSAFIYLFSKLEKSKSLSYNSDFPYGIEKIFLNWRNLAKLIEIDKSIEEFIFGVLI